MKTRESTLHWALFVAIALACVAHGAERRYWIEACTRPDKGCLAQDPQLADWALQDWARASSGTLKLVKVNTPDHAQIRIYWAGRNEGLYGEAQPIEVDGEVGANVYVLADLSGAGPDIAPATASDPLLRDAIVYLTCLHESGHALGLAHTAAFPDIMYSFRYGGDIPEYFGRYRRQLMSREDIRKTTGTSEQDRIRLLKIYAPIL